MAVDTVTICNRFIYSKQKIEKKIYIVYKEIDQLGRIRNGKQKNYRIFIDSDSVRIDTSE